MAYKLNMYNFGTKGSLLVSKKQSLKGEINNNINNTNKCNQNNGVSLQTNL